MTTKELIRKTLKVIENATENGLIGKCYTEDKATCYILGNHLFKSPIEFIHSADKTMFSLLFYDTMDVTNWLMTTRRCYKGYFIQDGKFYQPIDIENTDEVVLVSTKQVLAELELACKQWKHLNRFSNAMEETNGNVFESFKN